MCKTLRDGLYVLWRDRGTGEDDARQAKISSPCAQIISIFIDDNKLEWVSAGARQGTADFRRKEYSVGKYTFSYLRSEYDRIPYAFKKDVAGILEKSNATPEARVLVEEVCAKMSKTYLSLGVSHPLSIIIFPWSSMIYILEKRVI